MAVAPEMMVPSEARASRLKEHSGYLDSLVSMVPPKFYFPPDPDELAKKFQKHVNKPAAQSGDKMKRKMEANERKRARLDPDQLTVPQQQQLAAEQEAQERELDRQQQQRRRRQQDGEVIDDEDEPAVSAALSGIKTGDPSSVGELRARLQDKLEKMRGGRGGTPKPREVREREKEQAKADKQKRKPNVCKGGEGSTAGASAGAAATSSETAAASHPAAPRPAPGVGAVFNKVVAPPSAAEPWKAKRKLSDAQLLAQAEEAAGKRRQRQAEGEELGIEVWQKALEKAGGVKQKDDPSLLKKAMKRKERQKKKSAREWKSRINTVAKAQLDRQKQRTDNLAARGTKGKARSAKRKEAAKRRPGFEGTAPLLN